MESSDAITVQVLVNAPVHSAWKCFTEPMHVMAWNHASGEWHCPKAASDLQEGGKFSYRMEARDGSFGFDFEGIYDTIKSHELIGYHLADGRRVAITFKSVGSLTEVKETFDPENINPAEMQRAGWQAILDNFKIHTESVQPAG